jgi:hypothetical protein
MRARIFFEESDKNAIIEFVAAALKILQPHLTHYRAGSMRRPEKFTPQAETVVPSWFQRPKLLQWFWAIYGNRGLEGAVDASIEMGISY